MKLYALHHVLIHVLIFAACHCCMSWLENILGDVREVRGAEGGEHELEDQGEGHR